MAEDKTRKVILEREYIVPLREGWLKAPRYKRGKKAVKILKEFMVRHMKIYDRDLNKVRIDVLLNNEILFRGMKTPPSRIKVRAIKYEDGIVDVKLVNIPKHIEFELARKAKKESEKVKATKEEVKKEEKKQESAEKKEDIKEKEEASKIATEELEKAKAKEAKHTSTTSQQEPKIQRKALKR
jgi:large subunit ribosomal protein L31e